MSTDVYAQCRCWLLLHTPPGGSPAPNQPQKGEASLVFTRKAPLCPATYTPLCLDSLSGTFRRVRKVLPSFWLKLFWLKFRPRTICMSNKACDISLPAVPPLRLALGDASGFWPGNNWFGQSSARSTPGQSWHDVQALALRSCTPGPPVYCRTRLTEEDGAYHQCVLDMALCRPWLRRL